MTSGKVSVVITTYNRIVELERAIKSVLDQTYSNIELIIIDDNDDARISKIVAEMSCSYGAVYKKNTVNLGGALSRNEGIKLANGEYIAFLDDDDEYLPLKIEKQVELFEKSKVEKLGVVYCYAKAVNEKGEVVEIHRNDIRGNYMFENMLNIVAATSQWLCLKSAVLNMGGFRDVPSKQDTTFLMDMALSGYHIDFVPEVLSIYHESDIERISTLSIKNLSGELILRENMREHYNLFTEKQIKMIEYNRAWHIYYKQIRLGLFKDSDKSIKDLIKNNQIGIKLLPVLLKHPLRRIIKPKIR